MPTWDSSTPLFSGVVNKKAEELEKDCRRFPHIKGMMLFLRSSPDYQPVSTEGEKVHPRSDLRPAPKKTPAVFARVPASRS